jgi:uncharacterized protein YlxW (UPF0749 family)
MFRVRSSHLAIALVCVVLGFMLSMQVKVKRQVALRDVAGYQRAQDLAEQLAGAEQERAELMKQVDELRTQLRSASGSQTARADLVKHLELAQLHAGLVPVRGPGVVVVLDDSKRPVQPGENPNNFIIHDEDILRVINELTAGGAEALSVNDQRIIGRTEIRCVGPTVTINGVRTAPPVVIKAIGNPQILESTLTARGGAVEGLKMWGLQVTVKRDQDLLIPAFKGSLKLDFARPVPVPN